MPVRDWYKVGQSLEQLPGVEHSIVDIIQFYGNIRKLKNYELYRQALTAYGEAMDRRVRKNKKGKAGILEETADILHKKYKWEEITSFEDVNRYLVQARKLWPAPSNKGRIKGLD